MYAAFDSHTLHASHEDRLKQLHKGASLKRHHAGYGDALLGPTPGAKAYAAYDHFTQRLASYHTEQKYQSRTPDN
eukprot:4681259-Pleurochrysis_carterae.AAC.1